MRILHADDDRLQLEIACGWLERAGHTVRSFTQGLEAVRAMESDSFDLAILDWMIPDLSGEDMLKWIRKRNMAIPVLFVTSNDSEEQIAHILELGADDYLVKPLRPREFAARIAALARRAGCETDGNATISLGTYRCEPRSGEIFIGDRPAKMTPRMTAVALLLFRKRGELLSRREIYEGVWGHRNSLDTRTVDTHISRLRAALELDGRHGWRLASVYQHGYRLEEIRIPGKKPDTIVHIPAAPAGA